MMLVYRMSHIAHLFDIGDSIRNHQHSRHAAALAMTDGMMAMHNRSRSHKIEEAPLPRERSRSPVRPAPAADPARKGLRAKAKKMGVEVAKAEKPLLSEVMKTVKHGALTAQAHKAGYKTALEFAHHVDANPEKYNLTTRKRATFLLNLVGNK